MNKISLISLLVLLGVFSAYALETPPLQGTMSGTLLLKNGCPVTGAGVMFFNTATGPPPSPDKYWRVADVKTGTDSNGRFRVNLAAGTYYLGVTKHSSGKLVGPPEEGELFLPSPDSQGIYKQYAVKTGEITDIGNLAEVVPFKRAEHGSKGTVTAVQGTITDDKGNPVENVIVFAHAKPDVSAKPLFVSDKTGKDGIFLLKLPESGTYYLKARSIYGGGKPKQNEIIGLYGTKVKPTPVKVETGKITGGVMLGGFIFIEPRTQKKLINK